jgi:hypothetical protein
MERGEYLVFGLICAAVAVWVLAENTASAAEVDVASTPEGIRNNNPLNMVFIAADPYNGQVGKDSNGYAIYDTWQNGVRAGGKNLTKFYNEGKVTTRELATAWSITGHPNYENYVAAQIGVSPDDTLAWPDDQLAYVMAAIHFENGENPYSQADVQAALNS